MPYKITPLVEGQLVLVTTWGALTSEELFQSDDEFCAILDQSTHPQTHIIYDWSRLEAMPTLADLKSVRLGHHPRSGWAVFCGINQILFRFAIGVAAQIFRHRVRFFDQPAEALTFLSTVDPTLPSLSALMASLPAYPGPAAHSTD